MADKSTGKVLLYFAPLSLLIYLVLPHNYLVDIPTAYILKNRLHASASQVATFRLVTAIPVYLSFLFGFSRDVWSPFGLRDRGYFLLFGALTALAFLGLALAPLSYGGLLVGMLMAMASFRFLMAAYQGLMALVGQERLMSGRITALWQIVNGVTSLGAGFAAGFVSQRFSPSQSFLLIGILALAIAALAFWKPAAVFAHAYERPEAQRSDLIGDLKRLVRHKAIYPALLIMLLFQFFPGFGTPLQYYLSDQLHASDAVFGQFNGIFAASFVPMYFLYGFLCRRLSLKLLLWVGTIISIPQLFPLLFIHSGQGALMMAVPMGLMGGIAVPAIYDLTMRSCPPGLQGTLMMLAEGAYILSARGSDVLGSAIYDASPKNGFLYCAVLTAVVYACVLPVLLFIPKQILASRDGVQSPQLQAQTLAETAAPQPAT
jgi:Na+/melibiose symporter-like transporter